MRLLLLFLAFVGVTILFLLVLKNTIFEFSIRKKRFAGALIARELLILMLLGTILLEITDASRFQTFYATDQSIKETTPIIFYAVAMLLVSIGFFSRTIFRKYLLFDSRDGVANSKFNQNSTSLLDATAFFLCLMLALASIMGAKHAFLSSILGDVGLLEARLKNAYENSGPDFVMGYARIATILLSVLLGFFGSKISPIRRYFYLLLMVFSATFPGDKSPLVNSVFLFYISFLTVKNHDTKKIVVVTSVAFTIFAALVFGLTKIQFPEKNLEDLIIYLIERVGIGQIFGVHEQFALKLQDFSYIFNEIPFSGIFGYNRSMAKDLMMLTGGYGMRPEDIGVMNSLFIGEAFAIGGPLLLYTSPIIVAFNYTLLTYLTVRILINGFNISKWHSKRVAAIFVAAAAVFSGDLGGLLIFKKIIALMIFWFLVFLSYKSLKILRYSFYDIRV